jgi:hypothetical protein
MQCAIIIHEDRRLLAGRIRLIEFYQCVAIIRGSQRQPINREQLICCREQKRRIAAKVSTIIKLN